MKKRTFTSEFKKETVALVNEQGYTVAKAAAPLGLSDQTLREQKPSVSAFWNEPMRDGLQQWPQVFDSEGSPIRRQLRL